MPNDSNNTWLTYTQSADFHGKDSLFVTNIMSMYFNAIKSAKTDKDWTTATEILNYIQKFQEKYGAEVIPATYKTKWEVYYNNLELFSKLFMGYFILGLLLLVFVIMQIFKERKWLDALVTLLKWLIYGSFALHTIGLIARGIISGHAPWSNGYESMIYIAWTSVLAGLIFTRKSLGAMAATMVLGGAILLIAMLSYLDPEITPLVPVLKSYWLTIHVSLIAGSYGFLMLGAIIGFINLLMYVVLRPNNKSTIIKIIKEMTYISEMTLTGGIVLLSVGTYLGGVWANESWGRYWGWDAKETWALVSILVYAFILHMRLIPGLKSIFAYNFATLFGLSSVIMTYFGVNYYLSGLHAYAAGDPVPIPMWVYYAVAAAAVVSLVAYLKKNKYEIS